MPSIFLSHGMPGLVFRDLPERNFLKTLGARLALPRAVLVISAHWYSRDLRLTASEYPETLHDFGGLAQYLYDVIYPAPGAVSVAHTACDHLERAGYATVLDDSRGLDHGAWVPLRLMYPMADVPVVQLSVPLGLTPEELLVLGRCLLPLRQLGVLVIGSGGMVHNLKRLGPQGRSTDRWATGFSDWMAERIMRDERHAAARFRTHAPYCAIAHPVDDHLRPLFVAWGAGDTAGCPLFRGFSYGNLCMDAYTFGEGAWRADGDGAPRGKGNY